MPQKTTFDYETFERIYKEGGAPACRQAFPTLSKAQLYNRIKVLAKRGSITTQKSKDKKWTPEEDLWVLKAMAGETSFRDILAQVRPGRKLCDVWYRAKILRRNLNVEVQKRRLERPIKGGKQTIILTPSNELPPPPTHLPSSVFDLAAKLGLGAESSCAEC